MPLETVEQSGKRVSSALLTIEQIALMKIENAKIRWLESGLPYSTKFQDIYYSQEDAMAESLHVFLDANKLRQRWEHGDEAETFTIGELGFGSGLNFLQTMKLWQEMEKRPARLHYIAFEKHPLTSEHLQRIHQYWTSLSSQSAELLEQYTDHSEGCHRILLNNGISLDLYYGDALEQLSRRKTALCPPIQCWFLDGFSPANNSELWEQDLMQMLANCSEENTTLSSYSVAGKVRSALKNAGFEVSKREGFGKKRHCLFATMPAQAEIKKETAQDVKTPWLILEKPQFREKSAVVIGAGLAGCSTAYSLAQRGWKVSVIDAASAAASAASGNSQLALRCRLFNSPSPEAEFFLHAYLFAVRQFAQMQRDEGIAWKACGVLQLLNAMNKKIPLRLENLQQLYAEQLLQGLSKSEASRAAGIDLSDEAWFFPSGGAIEPVSLCESYLAHSNIRRIFNTRITKLHRTGEKWQLYAEQQQLLESELVVIANSQNAKQLTQCADLPLQSLRGQVTEISSNENSKKLKCVVSGTRTVFPSHEDRHLLSASYSNSDALEALPSDSQENIAAAKKIFSEAEAFNTDPVLERVALRCNSPDRLPLVGPAPDLETMRTNYAELSRNAKAKFNSAGEYHSGLYLNLAHGSNGLASCPLSAEFLASLINRENLPLNSDMVDKLNPTRFLIKDLKKQRY